MSDLIEEHLDFLSSVVCSDIPTGQKISEILPLRELLIGEVLEGNPLVADFIRRHWSQLSRVLFALRTQDVDGFKDELLAAMIKYPPCAEPVADQAEELPEVAEEILEQA